MQFLWMDPPKAVLLDDARTLSHKERAKPYDTPASITWTLAYRPVSSERACGCNGVGAQIQMRTPIDEPTELRAHAELLNCLVE